jgi:RNA polymerase-binding transcription factor DksA
VSKSTSKKTPSKKTKATAAVKSTSKSVSKASTVKKSAAPTNAAKTPVSGKTTSKKTTSKKTPAKKKSVATKASPATNTNGKKPVSKSAPVTTRSKALKVNGKVPPPKLGKLVRGKPLNQRELKKFQKILLELRERLLGDILFLTTDNLHRAGRETGADLSGSAQHSADHGTDNFDREFALSLASTEQDVLYEVDEALMRIQEGEYGLCEMTGVQIERARLEVIPYTRYSVQAQSKMEQSRAKYRPFAQTFRGW